MVMLTPTWASAGVKIAGATTTDVEIDVEIAAAARKVKTPRFIMTCLQSLRCPNPRLMELRYQPRVCAPWDQGICAVVLPRCGQKKAGPLVRARLYFDQAGSLSATVVVVW